MGMLLGNKAWTEKSVHDDDYISEEDAKVSPLDDDFVRDEYQPSDDD